MLRGPLKRDPGGAAVAVAIANELAVKAPLRNPITGISGCTRRERPRRRRAAECSQQFPPSDGDCHTMRGA